MASPESHYDFSAFSIDSADFLGIAGVVGLNKKAPNRGTMHDCPSYYYKLRCCLA